MPINDISIQTGFNDYFYFLKTCKKYTGNTPGEYRSAYYDKQSRRLRLSISGRTPGLRRFLIRRNQSKVLSCCT
ncbi:MAG: AraC family transcriptional regulator [Lachnospiraceae bacterium]|nr:AraC family transcriptional regulator [Lachnospiraceae bacterium]